MKIVIAPDSFKGNLSSLQVASAIEKGIRRVLPGAKCVKVPMADGGEGTVQALVDARGGRYITRQVCGPMKEKVRARYALLADGETAVIEMAEASGLPLVEGRRKNPLKATTYGTGELMAHAINKGAKKIILGIGGSATNDAGAGMAQALGVRFLTQAGRVLEAGIGGGALQRIERIDTSAIHPGLGRCKVVAACDVNNPLCGKRGASHVFGPQKGASPAMVNKLDQNLRHFGKLVKSQLGVNILSIKGAGAAGGIGGGLVAFTGARLRSGIDIVVEATDLRSHLKKADLVITGEGRVDSQTPFGKTPAGVARAAARYRVPVIAIGGGLADDANRVFDHGIDGLDSAISRDMPLEEALVNSRRYIANAAERSLRMILAGKKMARRR